MIVSFFIMNTLKLLEMAQKKHNLPHIYPVISAAKPLNP